MWFNFFKEIILWLADLDARLLLIVNGAHSPFFDAVMWCISGRWIWVPFYIVLTYMLFRRFSWKRATLCLITIGLIILAADQTCASLIRPDCVLPISTIRCRIWCMSSTDIAEADTDSPHAMQPTPLLSLCSCHSFSATSGSR